MNFDQQIAGVQNEMITFQRRFTDLESHFGGTMFMDSDHGGDPVPISNPDFTIEDSIKINESLEELESFIEVLENEIGGSTKYMKKIKHLHKKLSSIKVARLKILISEDCPLNRFNADGWNFTPSEKEYQAIAGDESKGAGSGDVGKKMVKFIHDELSSISPLFQQTKQELDEMES